MSLFGHEWLRPWALLGLLAIPWILWASRARPSLLFPHLPLLAAVGRSGLARFAWVPLALRALALVGVVLALARPVRHEAVAGRDLTVEGIDIVLALDLSGSMQAVDFQPNDRLFVAKQVLGDFIRRRPNDRIGLVVFAGEAYTQCPPTLDHGVLRSVLEQVRVGAIADGTAIGNAIATSLNRLRDSEAKSRVVILITDGDSNAGNVSPLDAARMARELGIPVYSILVGQTCPPGQPCLVPFPAGKDPFGRTVFRKVELPVNFELLEQIAELSGAQAYRATDRASLEGRLQEVLESLERSSLEEESRLAARNERFDLWLLPALLLGLVEVLAGATLWRRFP